MITIKDLNKLCEQLKVDEGYSLTWYRDSEGLPTIGVGHLATKQDDTTRPWTPEEVKKAFDHDLQIAVKFIERNLPWTLNLDSPRHCALVNMAFNLNSRLLQFKQMLSALEVQDWNKASEEALNSKWAKQVKARAKRIAGVLKNGTW